MMLQNWLNKMKWKKLSIGFGHVSVIGDLDKISLKEHQGQKAAVSYFTKKPELRKY